MKKIRSLILQIFFIGIFSSVIFAGQLSGTVYHDEDRTSASYYAQQIDSIDTGLPDIEINLLDGNSETQLFTDANGEFLFDGLADGYYFIEVVMDPIYESTTRNNAMRTPKAVREGDINIVSIGDSIGVTGTLPFPDRLGQHFSNLTTTTVNNVAVGGSMSSQWLPGAPEAYFENRLEPLLPDADLITITLGGNDLTPYTEGMPPYDILQIILNFIDHPEYVWMVVPNIKTIFDAIRVVNPDCDIVYVIYPNFGNSNYIISVVGQALQPLTSTVMEIAMSLVRILTGQQNHGLLLADMIGMFGNTWMDPYLIDEVHPSDEGSQMYADVIFQTLGGAIVEPAKMGEDRGIAFIAPDLVPDDDDDDDDDDDNDDNDDNDDDDNDDNDDNDDDDNDDNDDDDDDDDDDNDDDEDDDDGDDDDDEESSCCG